MQLIPLDTTNQQHIDITYDILTKRFSNRYVNIYDSQQPTLDQHVAVLMSNRYKYYYLIEFDGLIVGYIYLANIDNEYGYFLHIENAIKAYRRNRGNIKDEEKIAVVGEHKIKKIFYFYGRNALDLLLAKHQDIKKITAKVNPSNKKSIQGVEHVLHFKPVYIYYELELP